MLIDTFTYFNEKELLELRIRMLYDHVDKFIICEGDHTYSGNYKGFQLQRVLDEIGVPQDKIQILEVKMPSYKEQPNAWVREYTQRDAAAVYIKDSDICIAGDLDEIPDPTKLELHYNILSRTERVILYLSMHNLQQRADREVRINGKHEYWEAAYMCRGSALREYTISQLRGNSAIKKPLSNYRIAYAYQEGIPHVAGWHFSWMGDPLKKLKSFSHWDEFDKTYRDVDILGRPDHSLVTFSKGKLPQLIFELPHIEKFLFK